MWFNQTEYSFLNFFKGQVTYPAVSHSQGQYEIAATMQVLSQGLYQIRAAMQVLHQGQYEVVKPITVLNQGLYEI